MPPVDYPPVAARPGITDVVVRRLRVNRDPRGTLVETLRADWPEVYSPQTRPFAQCYYSLTQPWVARDEARWHVHREQVDRFVVVQGNIILALYDPRAESPSVGRLDLVWQGEAMGDDGQTLVLIPVGVLHCFLAVGPTPALLLNYPTRLYNPADEGRVPFAAIDARLPDGTRFSWDVVRAREGYRRTPPPGPLP